MTNKETALDPKTPVLHPGLGDNLAFQKTIDTGSVDATFAYADVTPWWKFAIFMIVFIPSVALTAWTVLISRRLATFMEALASERMTWGEKIDALRKIWGAGKRARMKRVAGGDEPTRRTSRARPEGQVATSAD